MRQNIKRRARNFPLRSEMKSAIKRMEKMVKEGALEDAVKFLAEAYSIVDMACKKNIIVKNNAARKKSRLAKILNDLQEKKAAGASAPVAEKKAEKKEAKKEEKTEE